jgi:hypothetical protein
LWKIAKLLESVKEEDDILLRKIRRLSNIIYLKSEVHKKMENSLQMTIKVFI